MIKEKPIQNSILSYLKLKGFFAWPVDNVGIFDPTRGRFRRAHGVHKLKGVSDIIGVLPGGRLLAIEVKSLKGRIRPEQKVFITKVNEHGGLAGVCRSIEDVELLLKEYLDGSWQQQKISYQSAL